MGRWMEILHCISFTDPVDMVVDLLKHLNKNSTVILIIYALVCSIFISHIYIYTVYHLAFVTMPSSILRYRLGNYFKKKSIMILYL